MSSHELRPVGLGHGVDVGVIVGTRVDVDDGRVAGAIVADSGAAIVAVTVRGESTGAIVGA